MRRWFFLIAVLLCLIPASMTGQSSPNALKGAGEELKFVVYLSRHGVRSPTGKPEQYNSYSIASWPAWSVAPGYLTAHGYRLMELFGEYDRKALSSRGLLKPDGCEDASHVTILADSDQRTRESGKALVAGLFPGCSVTVHSLPEGVNDPLFHFLSAGAGKANSALAMAGINGRIGGDTDNLTAAYRGQLADLDRILATCGTPAARESKRISLFDIPAKLASGRDDHAAELRGPLNTASSLTENFLLEYTEGMDASGVGWGCVDADRLRTLIGLHTAASDFAQRTKPIAQMWASNLLDHIRGAIEQSVTGKAVRGAPGLPTDRALFLIGHDTNLTNIAGLLNLTWIVDGRRDDTPPGGALVFEVWQRHGSGEFFVQTYYTAQTLEQMRAASGLTPDNPPQRVHLFLPGCSSEDYSCSWPSFAKMLDQAIDRNYVSSR